MSFPTCTPIQIQIEEKGTSEVNIICRIETGRTKIAPKNQIISAHLLQMKNLVQVQSIKPTKIA